MSGKMRRYFFFLLSLRLSHGWKEIVAIAPYIGFLWDQTPISLLCFYSPFKSYLWLSQMLVAFPFGMLQSQICICSASVPGWVLKTKTYFSRNSPVFLLGKCYHFKTEGEYRALHSFQLSSAGALGRYF